MIANSWQIIRADCNRLFKFIPTDYQLRLWYNYQTRGKNENKMKHKEIVENAIGKWDVIIRLALRYVKKATYKQRKSNDEIARFVHWLVWSKYEMYLPTKNKKGEKFHGATFWLYALENKNKIEDYITKSGAKNMKKILTNMLNNLQA